MPARLPFLTRLAPRAAALWFAALAVLAHAGYPDLPVKLVIGFPPGGGGDLYGRALATELSKHLGQTVVVDNRPGAGGILAAEAVARAKPDGYTLLLAMSGNLATAPALRGSGGGSALSYKVPADFEFISELVETPYGLMVSATSKIRSVDDFIAAARTGKLTYASTGTGGAAQIVMEMVKQQGRLDILHVPYKGSGPALTDLIGGQVDSFFAPYTPLMGQINGGKVRLLAVSSARRVPALPNVPTLKESGIDVVMTQWYGLAAPAGTPRDVLDTLGRHVKNALAQPALQQVYRADGAQEAALTGDAFREFVLRDLGHYRQAVERGNLKAE